MVGALLQIGHGGWVSFLSFIAVLIASINIFGGFTVTQRMLKMFLQELRVTNVWRIGYSCIHCCRYFVYFHRRACRAMKRRSRATCSASPAWRSR